MILNSSYSKARHAVMTGFAVYGNSRYAATRLPEYFSYIGILEKLLPAPCDDGKKIRASFFVMPAVCAHDKFI
jgi:hypothetical protein